MIEIEMAIVVPSFPELPPALSLGLFLAWWQSWRDLLRELAEMAT
jgi:hypothetical protein